LEESSEPIFCQVLTKPDLRCPARNVLSVIQTVEEGR
jgi:hypothetical protein